MTLRRWYPRMLFLPLAFPLALCLLTLLLTGDWRGTFHPPLPQMHVESGTLPLIMLADVNRAFGAAALAGGVQYLLFSLFLIRRYRGRSAEFWGRLTWGLPVLFIPFCALGLMVKFSPGEAINAAMASLSYGYFYVLLAHLLTWAALRMHIIVDEG